MSHTAGAVTVARPGKRFLTRYVTAGYAWSGSSRGYRAMTT
jgi:hypothetical protein